MVCLRPLDQVGDPGSVCVDLFHIGPVDVFDPIVSHHNGVDVCAGHGKVGAVHLDGVIGHINIADGHAVAVRGS